MRLSAIAILAILALCVEDTHAFVKGTAAKRRTPQVASSSTELYVAKKKSDVESFRKAEFVSAVAEKLDTSKAGAEAALTAVLDTITDVSPFILRFGLIQIIVSDHHLSIQYVLQ
jgi:hypothetical protein